MLSDSQRKCGYYWRYKAERIVASELKRHSPAFALLKAVASPENRSGASARRLSGRRKLRCLPENSNCRRRAILTSIGRPNLELTSGSALYR
jgi:hypothetical protein